MRIAALPPPVSTGSGAQGLCLRSRLARSRGGSGSKGLSRSRPGYPWRPVTIILAHMRSVIVLAVSACCFGVGSGAETAQPAPKPRAPAPAPPRRAPAPAPAPACSRSRADVRAAAARGTRRDGDYGDRSRRALRSRACSVDIIGHIDRSGETNASGQVNFTGHAGGDLSRCDSAATTVITFEKEVALRAGQIADVDVTLNPAPPPPDRRRRRRHPRTAAAPPPPLRSDRRAKPRTAVDRRPGGAAS